MIEKYIAQVSPFAKDIDNLIIMITLVVGFWFILAELVFFWLLFKFRAKPGVKGLDIDGTNPKHKRWVSIPHYLVLVCDVFILVGAVRVWVEVKQRAPETSEVIRIVGQRWAWSFQYPGVDGGFDTKDDIKIVDEMHVKVGKNYQFELQSRDVLHSFSVPAFRLKQDAIPGRTVTGWFRAETPGVYDLQCTEICGVAHGIMGAKVIVDTPEAYDAWVKAGTPTGQYMFADASVPAAAPAAGAAPTPAP